MKRSVTAMGMTATILLATPIFAMSQDLPYQRDMPGNDAPAGPYMFYWGPVSRTAPHGRPENGWRYRRYDGRWWYFSTDNKWSYFTGDTWVPYTSGSDHFLSRRPPIGPIAGPTAGQGVIVRGDRAGLTLIAGDHPGAPHLKRGTVLPKYLKEEMLPGGQEVMPGKEEPSPDEEEPTPDEPEPTPDAGQP
ncbi:MAG TPA: hypothetical protein VG826_33505 [Pirellulales bacterium]|nr:hypothetical protein [Pirellulales bacterium]